MNIATEAQIQTKILKYLRKTYPSAITWKIHEDPVFGVSGIPDIMFIHAGKVFFFEVKKPGGKISRIQEVTLHKLQNNDIIAEVVYGLLDVQRLLTREGESICS